MIKKENLNIILEYIDSLFPNASCELNYSKDYEFVIAVMLSAQTTDKAVNEVTAILFNKYKTLEELANADIEDIENCIKRIGLYKVKASNVLGIAQGILTKFNGVVPSDKDLLMTLPGVGNKTAGVVRAELFEGLELPVDTHVFRISKRLGFTSTKDDVSETERKLKRLISKEKWVKTHHQFIHFGRYFCTAKKPKCDECKIKYLCKNKD